jgi:hypothetical protein
MNQWDDALATLSYNRQARAILKRLDKNSNQVIDRFEATSDPALSEKFRFVDGALGQREDGRLDAAEIKEWCRQTRAGEVSIGQLIELASQRLSLREGEVRLIAYSDDEIPGMTIQPGAAQVIRRTLFVVHLRRAPMTPAVRDVNCKADLTNERERRLDERDLEEFTEEDGAPINGESGLDDGNSEKKPSDSEDNDQAKGPVETTDNARAVPTSEDTP